MPRRQRTAETRGKGTNRMQKNHWLARIIYWVIIAIGSLLLGMYMAKTQWNTTVLALWLALIFLGALGVEFIWYRNLAKMINALTPLLRTDPDRYIAGIEALLGDVRSLGVQQTRCINLAAAYCEKEDYARAVELLVSLDPRRIPRVNQGAYWADLALARFCMGQDEQARAVIDGQSQLFSQMKGDPRLGGLAAVLSVYYARAAGDTQLAWERFCAAREAWKDPGTQKELDRLETRLRKEGE